MIVFVTSDVPSKPGMPQIGSLKSRTVSVWWSASTEENNSPISSYMIQVRLVLCHQRPSQRFQKFLIHFGSRLL